jgi:hypothetical protein
MISPIVMRGGQRGARVLEDHLHAPAHPAQGFAFQAGEVHVFEEDLAAGGLVEAQQGAGDGRFAAARFADQAEGFAAPDLERYAVHGLDRPGLAVEKHPALDGEMDLEITDLYQGRESVHGTSIVPGAGALSLAARNASRRRNGRG